MDKSQEIVDKLTPKHIQEEIPASTAELKAEIEAATSPESKKEDPSIELKRHSKYPFDFSWTSSNGTVWEGHFVNKILSIADRQNMGLTMARFGGGMPVESIDVLTNEINIIVSHMMYSLVECPDWAKDLRSLDDIALIQAIYEEVASHEATFFGPRTDKKGS